MKDFSVFLKGDGRGGTVDQERFGIQGEKA